MSSAFGGSEPADLPGSSAAAAATAAALPAAPRPPLATLLHHYHAPAPGASRCSPLVVVLADCELAAGRHRRRRSRASPRPPANAVIADNFVVSASAQPTTTHGLSRPR
jgi:hypothetical protein